jgi:hypothetical protein
MQADGKEITEELVALIDIVKKGTTIHKDCNIEI